MTTKIFLDQGKREIDRGGPTGASVERAVFDKEIVWNNTELWKPRSNILRKLPMDHCLAPIQKAGCCKRVDTSSKSCDASRIRCPLFSPFYEPPVEFYTVTSAAAANKHSVKRRRGFEVDMWTDHDTAFCDAWFCVDTNRHHSVTTGFTRFRLVTPSNCCP